MGSHAQGKWLVALHLFPSQWLVVLMYMHYMIQRAWSSSLSEERD